MSYVDIGIPCNTKGNHALGLMWWMLAREVLRLRGTISRDMEREVMPDLFFYRDPEEVEKEEQTGIEQETTVAKEAAAPEYVPEEKAAEVWGGDFSAATAAASAPATDWAAETEVHTQQQQGFAQQAQPAAAPSSDWATQVSSATDDWSATAAAAAPAPKSDWGGTAQGSWDA